MGRIDELSERILTSGKLGSNELSRLKFLSKLARPMVRLQVAIFSFFSASYLLYDFNGDLVARFYNPFLRRDKYKLRIPIPSFVINLITLYWLAKLMILFLLQALVVSALTQWTPVVRPGADKTDVCALEEDIYNEERAQIAQRIHTLMKMIHSLGSYYTAANKEDFTNLWSVPEFAFGLLAAKVIYMNLHYAAKPLNFILNPEHELALHKSNVKKLIKQLTLVSSRASVGWPIEWSRSRKADKGWRFARPRTRCICRLINREERFKFAQLLEKYDIQDSIHCPVYSLRTMLAYLAVRLYPIYYLLSWSTAIDRTLYWEEGLELAEADLRTERLENQAKCEQWAPGGTLIRDPMLFSEYKTLTIRPLPSRINNHTQPASRDAKFRYQLEWTDKYDQLPSHESWNTRILYLETELLDTVSVVLIRLLLVHLVESLANRLVWWLQLRQQLVWMNEMLLECRHAEKKTREMHREKIGKSLLVIMLNLRLYMKAHKAHAAWIQLVAFVVVYLILFEGVFSLVDDKAADAWQDNWYLIRKLAISNAFLALFFILLRAYRRLFHLVNLVYGNLISYERPDDWPAAERRRDARQNGASPPMGEWEREKPHVALLAIYWRKMIVDDSIVEDVYCNRFFGIKFTENNALNINHYLIVNDCRLAQ